MDILHLQKDGTIMNFTFITAYSKKTSHYGHKKYKAPEHSSFLSVHIEPTGAWPGSRYSWNMTLTHETHPIQETKLRCPIF